jgi:hypothetical protein
MYPVGGENIIADKNPAHGILPLFLFLLMLTGDSWTEAASGRTGSTKGEHHRIKDRIGVLGSRFVEWETTQASQPLREGFIIFHVYVCFHQEFL